MNIKDGNASEKEAIQIKLTKMGTDYVTISEENIDDPALQAISKIHIIKLDFINPTREIINSIMMLYPKTNRYIISDNIRIYNSILKMTAKKYYVENNEIDGLITFLRKNNKIFINVNKLTEHDKWFILDDVILADLLNNIEVIQLSRYDFNLFEHILIKWNGNVIIEK